MPKLDATGFLESLGCAHVLYFHDDSKITKDTEFGFIKKGLEKQEHCFYTTQNPEVVLNKMKEFGIDTEAYSKFLHMVKIPEKFEDYSKMILGKVDGLPHDSQIRVISTHYFDFDKNKENLTPSETYQAMRCFKRSKITPRVSNHAGLGLDCYVRITSPIRRYLDLVAQQQLLGFVTNTVMLDESMVKQRIKIVNSAVSNINKATKQSVEHYKCVYLKQNKKWKGKGVVVDLSNNKTTLLIPEIAMLTQLKLKSKYELDSEVELKIASIDLENRSVDFKPV